MDPREDEVGEWVDRPKSRGRTPLEEVEKGEVKTILSSPWPAASVFSPIPREPAPMEMLSQCAMSVAERKGASRRWSCVSLVRCMGEAREQQRGGWIFGGLEPDVRLTG